MSRFDFDIPGYRIDRMIGSGTYSKVYVGTYLGTGRRVAIKILDRQLLDYSQELRYAPRLLEISSSHLASLLDYGELDDGTTYLVLEWGGTEIFRWVEKRGSLPPEDAYLFIRQATEGIRTLHRAGFVHLDISPGNLFIDDSGQVKVSDFGMMVVLTGRSRQLDTKPRGTPGFTAPEVLRGVAHVSSDVFSLAAVLHWMLTGDPPEGDDTSETRREISDDLPVGAAWLIRKAINPDPDSRFQTLAEMSYQLGRLLRGDWTEPAERQFPEREKRREPFWRRWFGKA
ncbi:MAG: serine/threonine protein kinase [Planctomycetes bacterium]|nr:serine/threonine protein kinase [Planctomycetota bacterium]